MSFGWIVFGFGIGLMAGWILKGIWEAKKQSSMPKVPKPTVDKKEMEEIREEIRDDSARNVARRILERLKRGGDQ